LFEPSSLKPGDAIRQQEQALKNYMKRKTLANQQGRGGGGGARGRKETNALAKSTADLLDGTESQRLERTEGILNSQFGDPNRRFK
jgi:hypothetical protein